MNRKKERRNCYASLKTFFCVHVQMNPAQRKGEGRKGEKKGKPLSLIIKLLRTVIKSKFLKNSERKDTLPSHE